MTRWLFSLSMVLTAVQAAESDPLKAWEVLRANCFQCHTKDVAMSGLDLSSREAALKGGTRGAALVPGKSADSRIIQAVTRKTNPAMPPAKPLGDSEIEILKSWVDAGAVWPDTAPVAKGPVSNWWAFQKVKRPAGAASTSAQVDAYIDAALAAQKLPAVPAADRATLARRAYLDLWGLPPTAAQVAEFVGDPSPDAWAKLVDRLLASKHYGEKWGRHWLDLVRYSDTAGFELDPYIHDAWRYRDYVIESFNADKPYDRFIREQIAGDEFYPEDPVSITGTGLYCVGPNRDFYPDQKDINREEILTDFVDTTSAVFLGLTAGCARCHDHKFDPISQEDHYRIRAIFAPAQKTKIALARLPSLSWDTGEMNREWKLREYADQIRTAQGRCKKELFEAKLSQLPPEAQEALRVDDANRTEKQRVLATEYQGKAQVRDDDVRACMTPTERDHLHTVEKKLVQMFANYGPKPFSCGITDYWNVSPKTFIPARSGHAEREVQPGWFSILGGGQVPPPAEKRETTGPIPLTPTTGRRTALANWIADPENPLTARVMVNRIWQYHFGRGLVATPSDFGTRSGKPTHPELLDWLASEFMSNQWSMKHIHRLVMNSAAYQRGTNSSAEATERDPQNLYLSHFSRRRLNADEIRDSVLLATGALNTKMGGTPVVAPLSKEELTNLSQPPDNAWVVNSDTSGYTRRSVYMIQKRTFRTPMMEVFDAPESMLTCPRRDSSTTAPQSLTLLNGTLAVEQSRRFGTELVAKYPADDQLIQAAWSAIFARKPAADEQRLALEFLKTQSQNGGSRTTAAAELIRGLLNTNEFLYVD